MKQFGYITLALNGRPDAELAHNLAASIKASHWEAKVAVITNLGDSFRQYAGAFDEVIHTTEANSNKVKTGIYNLTPWDKTVFIDADSLFLWTHHNILNFEMGLDGLDLCFPVLGRFQRSQAARSPLAWVQLPELWTYYKFEDTATYQALDSSLFYFRKSRPAGKFFKEAVKMYGDYPKIKGGHSVPGGHFPDEIAFSVAATKQGQEFTALDGLTYRALPVTCNTQKALSHMWLSMPGLPSQGHRRFYNALVNNCGPLLGMAFPFRKT